jgi:hypothetical protein
MRFSAGFSACSSLHVANRRVVRAGLWLGLLVALGVSLALAPETRAQTPLTTVENEAGDARLQLNYDGGLYIPGTFIGPNDSGTAADSIPATGSGTRLMWYPAKAAFRAGRVGFAQSSDGTEWDASNVGFYSVAFGRDTKASGEAATAMGEETTASGGAATAMGFETTASGNAAMAMGFRTTASDGAATAIGSNTTASGNSATAMGLGTTATSFASLSIGQFNSANTSDDNTLFVAGNGSGVDSRSDALVLKEDGDFGLGPSSPVAHLHVQESVKESGATNLGRHAGVVENTSTESGADVFALKTALNNPGSITNFISFLDADEQVGTIQGTGGGIELTSKTADFAEELPVEDGARKPEAGEVVGVRGGEAGLNTRQADRVMIASTSPIMTGNATPDTEADDDRRVAVAFVGQVPAKIQGKAQVGDLIVASGESDGTGRAVDPANYRRAEHGPIAGQAWTAKETPEVGTVTVAVGIGAGRQALAERLETQKKENENQKERIAELEAENDQIKKRLAALEAERSPSTVAGLTGSGAGLLLTFLLGGFLGAGLLWRHRG